MVKMTFNIKVEKHEASNGRRQKYMKNDIYYRTGRTPILPNPYFFALIFDLY